MDVCLLMIFSDSSSLCSHYGYSPQSLVTSLLQVTKFFGFLFTLESERISLEHTSYISIFSKSHCMKLPHSLEETIQKLQSSSQSPLGSECLPNSGFFFFFFFMAAPTAYGNLQTRGPRGRIRAAAASHSHTGSEPHLPPVLQLKPGIKPTFSQRPCQVFNLLNHSGNS